MQSPTHENNGPTSPASGRPAPRPQTTLCPYCGHISAASKACERCRGMFEPLSRQASQNAMGPWFVRDESNPFLPGFSLATLRQLVRRGRISPDTIIKGPSTRQFWAYARGVPGVGHLLGACHVCRAPANADMTACGGCGASFEIPDDREHLGLTPVRLLPGHADPAQIAATDLVSASTASIKCSVSAEPATNEQTSQAWMASSPGEEIDAAGLIAARQRQRRAQRRTTISIVVLVVVCIGATAAVVAVIRSRNGSAPIQPPTGTLPPAQSSPALSNASPVNEVSSLAQTESENPGMRANPILDSSTSPMKDDSLDPRLITAKVDELAQLIETAAAVGSAAEGVDSELAAAISAAKVRLAVGRAGRRL